MLNKDYLLRTTENLFEKIREKAEKDDRSVNYTMNKMLEDSFSSIKLEENIVNEIEAYCNKARITKEDLIIGLWNAHKKTYKKK